MKLYGIVGCGGFGREVIPLVKVLREKNTDCQLVFVDDKKLQTPFVNGYEVFSFEEFFNFPAEEKFFNVAIANSTIRKKLVERMLDQKIQPFQIKAANHMELDHNKIAEGAIFCPFTIVTSNTQIGKYFHANIYSYVAHDCVIGDYVTFAPNVHCNGKVIIEDDVYVGTGVIIREGTMDRPLVIGKGAVLGMGAVITKSVPAYQTVVGNPAIPLKYKATT